jgi:hypothetical protein
MTGLLPSQGKSAWRYRQKTAKKTPVFDEIFKSPFYGRFFPYLRKKNKSAYFCTFFRSMKMTGE